MFWIQILNLCMNTKVVAEQTGRLRGKIGHMVTRCTCTVWSRFPVFLADCGQHALAQTIH